MAEQIAPNRTPSPTRYERAVGVAVLVLLLAGSFVVLRPFLSALLWAIVLAFSVWPAHRRLVARLNGRRTVSALLITSTMAAVLVVPLTVTVANLADDARALATAGRGWLQSGLPPAPVWLGKVPLLGPRTAEYWEGLRGEFLAFAREVNPPDGSSAPTTSTAPATEPAPVERSRLRQAVRTIVIWTKSWLLAFGLVIGQGVMQVILSLLLMFFILKNGAALAERLASMARMVSGDRGTELLDVAGTTVRGVIYGILGTALAQGLMAGLGFLIAGVPGATLLGLLTFFLSVIPMGPPLVWIPASIWLFHQGSVGWGIFIIVWGLLVSSVDNVIKPLIISRGSKMPFILIFFGVLGGALTFGLIGVFIGPTLLAVAYRLIEEWSAQRTLPSA